LGTNEITNPIQQDFAPSKNLVRLLKCRRNSKSVSESPIWR